MSAAVGRRFAQAGRLAREVIPCLQVLGRVARAALRTDRRRAGLALLEAAPVLRAGTPASIHVRAVNPGPDRCTLAISVAGGTGDGVPFRVDWQATLDAGAVDDRWIVTTWHGDASLHATPPALAADLGMGTPSGRWHVTADAGSGVPLAIAGALVR